MREYQLRNTPSLGHSGLIVSRLVAPWGLYHDSLNDDSHQGDHIKAVAPLAVPRASLSYISNQKRAKLRDIAWFGPLRLESDY